jgi:hypothetical protein
VGVDAAAGLARSAEMVGLTVGVGAPALPEPRGQRLGMDDVGEARERRTERLLAQVPGEHSVGRRFFPPGHPPLATRAYRLMPKVRVTDLLEEVDTWTGFGDHFGHVSTGLPPKERRGTAGDAHRRGHEPRSQPHGGRL